jgi:DedD protein
VDNTMKQRMVGAIVLVALAVIFIPMLLEDKEPPVESVKLDKQIPREPSTDYRTDLIPTEEAAKEAVIDSRTTMEIPLETITEPERPPELPEAEAQAEATAIEEARKEEWVIVEENAETPPEKRSTESVESAPKTQAPKVVETPPAAPIEKGWTIQAGSFGQKTNAEKLMANLRLKGMSAYLSEIKVQDKTLYRVRIGPIESKQKAEQQLRDVETNFKLKGAIIPP